MATAHFIKKASSFFISKIHPKPAFASANNMDSGVELENKVKEQEEVKSDRLSLDLSQFLKELDSQINEINETKARSNKEMEEAKAKYPFLNTPSNVYQPGGELHNLVFWPADNKDNAQTISKSTPILAYDQVINPSPYNEAISNITNTNTSLINNNGIDVLKNKSFFRSFSSPLKKIHDSGISSFNIVKDISNNISTSVLSSKITKAFNFVNNKVFSYLDINQVKNISSSELAEIINAAPKEEIQKIISKIPFEKLFEVQKELLYIQNNKLIEKIITTPKNELDGLLKKISHEKLAELINTKGLTSDENLTKIFNIIPIERLAKIIDITSSENLEKIIDNVSDQDLSMILHYVSNEKNIQILTLIHGEEYIEQLKTQQEAYNEYHFENNYYDFKLLGTESSLGYNFGYDHDIVYV